MKEKCIFSGLFVVLLALVGCNTGVSGKYEGGGTKTPEAAIELYLGGLREGDFNKMVSAFAIESFVKNFDFENRIERLNAYVPMDKKYVLGYVKENQLAFKAGVESRRAEVISYIYDQILNIGFWKFSYAGTDGSVVSLNESSQRHIFLKPFDDTSKLQAIGKLKVLRVLSANEVAKAIDVEELFKSEANQKNIKAQAKMYGGDELAEFWLVVSIGSEKYTMFFQTIQYGGKWYINGYGGNLCSLMGISAYIQMAGICGTEHLDSEEFDIDILLE